MSRRLASALTVLVVAVSIASLARAAPPDRASSRLITDAPSHAATFAVATDGDVFYADRLTGEIRIFDQGARTDRHFFTVPDVIAEASNSRGLLGLALHPTRNLVYAYATRLVNEDPRIQIVRVRDRDGAGSDMKVIFRGKTLADERHLGGPLAFGPDGMLYVAIGEGFRPELAQDLSNERGKILRMTHRGRIPDDNPFDDSRIYAYGFRNMFGFEWDPQTGRMWEDDNGPECNDELNLIRAGRNYGWGPNATCDGTAPGNTNQDGPDPVMPEAWYGSPIAPTGLAFCDGCGLGPQHEGRLLFGTFNTDDIREVTLDGDRDDVSSQRVLYTHDRFVLSVEAGPDGTVYFSDGDAIFELIPG